MTHFAHSVNLTIIILRVLNTKHCCVVFYSMRSDENQQLSSRITKSERERMNKREWEKGCQTWQNEIFKITFRHFEWNLIIIFKDTQYLSYASAFLIIIECFSFIVCVWLCAPYKSVGGGILYCIEKKTMKSFIG